MLGANNSAFIAGALIPEALIAGLFYWWYGVHRRPVGVDATPDVLKVRQRKAVGFSVLIFVVLLVVAAYGGSSSNGPTGTTWKKGMCVSATNGKVTGVVSCSKSHFAMVVGISKTVDACPYGTLSDFKEDASDSSPASIVCLG